MDMPLDHLAGVTVHLQPFTVLKETAGVSNAHGGVYAAFASKRGCVLKNRAFLDYQSGDAWEQRCKMWMEDAENKNRTCRNGHNVFGVAYDVRLPAGMSRCGAQARVDCR